MEQSVVMLTILVLTIIAEWGLAKPRLWTYRRHIALVCLVLMSFACTGLLLADLTIWSVGLALTAAYRAVNLARVMEDRMHHIYARQVVARTADWLGTAQLSLAAGLLLVPYPNINANLAIVILAALQLLLAVCLAWTTRRQLRTTAIAHENAPKHDTKLPPITVAVPARNEDQQLDDCLRSIMASDYPKLEVIVLDDCSQDRTSEIIRSYAHAGVRFIQGHEPSDGWLPKNQAYDKLYREASGSLILFCGVDVRFKRDSIRKLEHTLHRRQKSMLSVLPLNDKTRRITPVQAMRYFWEMVPPRRWFKRPPVLSSCWLVRRELLEAAGGFDAVRRSVTPEAHFAHRALTDDGYSFVRSDAHLGISSEKPLDEQMASAIQARYPQVHRRPEMVFVTALLEAVWLLGPAVLLVYGLLWMHWIVALLSVAAMAVHHVYFGQLQAAIFPRAARQAYLSFVPTILTDIALLHYSMYKYEFSEVFWRGRNVCYPVMHVVSRLPKL